MRLHGIQGASVHNSALEREKYWGDNGKSREIKNRRNGSHGT